MKKIIFAILALVVLIACQVQVPEQPVEEGGEEVVTEPEAQTMYDSLEACEAAGVECVAESTYFGLTGRYLVFGRVMEGQHVSLSFDQKPEEVCEEGLTAVHDLPIKEAGCLIPMCPCYVCTKCGNGECGLGEDKCNCPQDCKIEPDAPEALPQEERVVFSSYEECETAGLDCVTVHKRRSMEKPYFVAFGDVRLGEVAALERGRSPDGLCAEGSPLFNAGGGPRDCAIPMSPAFVCAQCGDGECGIGEDVCNCAKDCIADAPLWQNVDPGVWIKKTTKTNCSSNEYRMCISECYENANIRSWPWEDAWNPHACEWGDKAHMETTDTGTEVLCFETGYKPKKSECKV